MMDEKLDDRLGPPARFAAAKMCAYLEVAFPAHDHLRHAFIEEVCLVVQDYAQAIHDPGYMVGRQAPYRLEATRLALKYEVEREVLIEALMLATALYHFGVAAEMSRQDPAGDHAMVQGIIQEVVREFSPDAGRDPDLPAKVQREIQTRLREAGINPEDFELFVAVEKPL